MENLDDRENQTPAGNVPENKDEAVTGQQPVNQPKEPESEVEKRIAEKKRQLEQLETAAREETERIRNLRAERRKLDEPATIDTYMQPEEDTKKQALEIFYKMHPEYHPTNDIGNELFNELNSHYKRMISGPTVAEQVDTLDYIHNNLIKSRKASEKEEVAPMNIGDTSSVDANSTPKDSPLIRKLNKWEQDAARNYPGGEKDYREALASKEESKKRRYSNM